MNEVISYKIGIPDLIEVEVLNLGCIIKEINVFDKFQSKVNVVLGPPDKELYLNNPSYFGAVIGRYANRIKAGKFSINGRNYEVSINENKNSLHGGKVGFDQRIWTLVSKKDDSITLSLHSEALDQGYPESLDVTVTYTVSNSKELIIDYIAHSSGATPINLTNHTYFNLSGGSSSILTHELWINADSYTPVDEDLIPTGKIEKLPPELDFNTLSSLGEKINKRGQGIDLNYILNEVPLKDPKARLIYPRNEMMMEVFTTEPGLQLYTGDHLRPKYSGLCLETQHYPDSPNQPEFPSTILTPDETFTSKTIYRFQ